MSATLPVGSGFAESPLDTLPDRIEAKWEELYEMSNEEIIQEITRIIGEPQVAIRLAETFQDEIAEYWAEHDGEEEYYE